MSDWLGNTTTYVYGNFSTPSDPTNITYSNSNGLAANYAYDNDGNLTSLQAGTSSNQTSE